MTTTEEKQLTIPQAHKWFAVECNNGTWDLIEKADRTPDEDLRLVHMAHAAKYHWSQVPTATVENEIRADNTISRAYSAIGEGGAAKYYAQRCIDNCHAHGIGDWDLASAYGAMAYACQAAGNSVAQGEWTTKAKEACADIKEDEDRNIIEQDLAKLA
ncbi:MAG TPA: hypothetical protein VEI97_04685 [bacterium]|nr:hypothetical protein [bacterium]